MKILWLRMKAKYGDNAWFYSFGDADVDDHRFIDWCWALSSLSVEQIEHGLSRLPDKMINQMTFKNLCLSKKEVEEPKALNQQEERELKARQENLQKKINAEMANPKPKVVPQKIRDEALRKLRVRWSGTDWMDSPFGDWCREQQELEQEASIS